MPDAIDPLADFYSRQGLVLPAIERVERGALPEPYRTLLAHDDDMTPTLERFHGQTIHLRILGSQHIQNLYSRQVVLLLDGSGTPVEYGAIAIGLDRFAPPAQQMILADWKPLGTILRHFSIRHQSRPKAFLRLRSDASINAALGLSDSHVLYGRRNTLLDGEGAVLAEAVEIVPPVASVGP